MYVCTSDVARLLRNTPLSEALAARAVSEEEFIAHYAAGEVGAAVVDCDAQSPRLAAALRNIRRTCPFIPVVELSPIAIRRDIERAEWAHAAVRRDRAHLDLLPAIRRSAVESVLTAAGTGLRHRFPPKDAAEVVLCVVPTRAPPFVSAEEVARFGNTVVTTLDRRWQKWLLVSREAHVDVEQPTVSAYVGWTLFLRALAEKRNDDEGWTHVAARLRTTRKRLGDFALAECGQPIKVLEVEQPVYAIERFEATVLAPLGISFRWNGAI